MAKSKIETVRSKLVLIEGWARDGLTDEQIAKNLGVAYSTFREYIKKDSAISAALKKGKEVIDYEVENALLKRALGYTNKKKIYSTKYNRHKGEYELELDKITEEEVPPDTTALIYWLKNRRPDKWREKQELSINTSKVDELLDKIKDDAK